MDAGILGGIIGVGVMVGVVLVGTLYEKCKGHRWWWRRPISSHTPLLATVNPQQDLASVLHRQKSHVKMASVLPKPKIHITITRQNGSRTVSGLGQPKN